MGFNGAFQDALWIPYVIIISSIIIIIIIIIISMSTYIAPYTQFNRKQRRFDNHLQIHQVSYDNSKRWVFSLHMKMFIDSTALTDSGNVFQAEGSPTAKERSPNLLLVTSAAQIDVD